MPEALPMSQTDDLREALARAIFERGRKQGGIDPETWEVAGDEMQAWLLGHADAMIAGPFAPILAQVSALQAEVERLQKVEGERGRLERDPSGPGYSSSAPSPQAVSASGEYPSRGPSDSSRPSADYQDGFNTANERADERIRELEAEVAQLDGRLTDAVLDKALMAKRIRELKAEVARLTERLISGPANMQECAEFCRVAREDGDGKPCLDCHPECFHF